MATTTSQAGQAWHHALKTRKGLLKQLERLQAGSASVTDASQFEAIDGLLEKFRLACVQTIFLDFKYAVKENTEEALWGLHISINSEYKRTLGRLRSNSHAVERRKVEKMYNNFLRIAQKFYKGYIQRLSARYGVPELRRVARGIDLDQMDTGDTISPVPADLSAMVLKSCYSTLLSLGDLARYRIQAKHKSSGYEMALTYYSLARHLMPQSGWAFHQMGIVNIDQANHLDVVYHFYRAWAVEVPHPNAKCNLESEFKSLRLPSSAKARHNPPAPQDAFSSWFVKLHALFHKGEPFSQQKELEEEVMHRLEMACRNASSGDTLLKMAMVNMSAYDFASKAFSETETESASRFWQFTLRFNALFVMTFCRVFQSELQEAASNRVESSSGVTAVELKSTIENLLPTLRIYCVWLVARRQELFGASHTFGAIVPTMVQNIVKVFTLLCVVTYNQDNLASCPYLLPEDLEVRGIRPLDGDQVPKACRVYCDENGNMKPYLYDSEQRLDATKENMARILDVLRCAYFLAEDDSAPVSYHVAQNCLVFEYRPDVTSGTPHNPEAVLASSASPHVASQIEAPAEHTPVREAQVSGQPRAFKDNSMDMGDQQEEEQASGSATCQLSPEEEHAERTVIAMLTPFLKPPTPPPRHYARSPDESSYGMHTSTANDVFGSFQTYSSPVVSGQPGSIAPLPWAWDNTPKPDGAQVAANSAGKEAFMRTSRNNSQSPLTRRTSLEDPFATPGRNASRVHAQAYFGPPKSGNPGGSTPGSATETAHKDHLLQSFATTSVPRTSLCSPWGEKQAAAWPGGSPWGPRLFDSAPLSVSTGTTDFSHQSSVYMGTPAEGIGLGLSGHEDGRRNRPRSPPNQCADESSTRRVQISDSASSYDEAIFRAAWVGK